MGNDMSVFDANSVGGAYCFLTKVWAWTFDSAITSSVRIVSVMV